jgi:hypothetical protein
MTDKWKEFDGAVENLEDALRWTPENLVKFHKEWLPLCAAHRVLDLLAGIGHRPVMGLEIYTRHIKDEIEIAIFFKGWTTDIEDGFAGADIWIFDCETFSKAVFATVTSDEFKEWQKENE